MAIHAAVVKGLASLVQSETISTLMLPAQLIGVLSVGENLNLEFNLIKAERGMQLGLSLTEQVSYNSEIQKINRVATHVANQLSFYHSTDPKDAAVIWDSVRSELSAETTSALNKIANVLTSGRAL